EEQELSEQQLKRKVEVQKAAQFYTKEDWDTIREKLEANTEVVKSLQGDSISNDDFAKRMVEMINEKKKLYAEQKAKAKRSKPMTQAQQREYMSTFIKNQSSWKLSQLKKLSFEELTTEFEKLMKSIESFVPMETEAKEKVDVVKEEETEVPVKKTGKRRKQKARKGINIDKTRQDEFNKEKEAYVKDKVKDASSESEIRVDVIPTATIPHSIVNWKIIYQSSQKAAYQILRKDGSDKICMSFGAILKDFSRDELVELYRLVIMNDDAIWSLPLQQKIINWRYYPTCAIHCLTLGASTIYMLADRKYPFSKDACQVMLKMKLLDRTMDEVCYQLLKMIEKQAGIRKHIKSVDGYRHKNWLVHKQTACEQTATGKEISNPLIADSLLKTVRLSLHLVIAMKHWLVHKQTAHGKDIFIGESNNFLKRQENTTKCGIQNLLGYFVETKIEDFDNITFRKVMTMAISKHFFYTEPSIGQRFVFMLRKGTDFSEESVERAGGKNRLMKAVQSSSHVLIVPSLSSFSHVFASLVSDRGNITNFIFSISVFKHIADSEEFMNVFMRIGFGSAMKLVSFDKGQVVTFNSKFVSGFRNSDCRTRSWSDNTVGSSHRFIIHWIVISKNIKKVTEVVDVKNWRVDNSRVL
ncbi:hypothetical protein Tco_1150923, partial [Tanacetum coccineum]